MINYITSVSGTCAEKTHSINAGINGYNYIKRNPQDKLVLSLILPMIKITNNELT